MLRNIERLVSSGTERMTRDILEIIIEAAEKQWGEKVSFYSYLKNFDDIVKHFSAALSKVLKENISEKTYQQMNEKEKSILIESIAQYFIDNASLMSIGIAYYKFHEYLLYSIFNKGKCPNRNIDMELKLTMDDVHLLPCIFYGDAKNLDDYVDDSIREMLFKYMDTPLKKCIHDFHDKKLVALAIGYTDKNSIFSTLPREMVQHIGNAMNTVHAQRKNS